MIINPIGLYEEKLLKEISKSSILRVYLKRVFTKDQDLIDKLFNDLFSRSCIKRSRMKINTHTNTTRPIHEEYAGVI